MNDLAHWIIDVGTGLLIGIAILGAVSIIIDLLDALGPIRVPVVTPLWQWMRDGIQWIIGKPIAWVDRKVDR